MLFYKTTEEIRIKLIQSLDFLKEELKKKEEHFEKQLSPKIELADKKSGKVSGKEFLSTRIFDPGDEYLQELKGDIEKIKKKINRFELIIRNLPKVDKVDLTLEELEEFGF